MMANLPLFVVLLTLSGAGAQSFCTPNQCPSKSSFALQSVDRTSSPANYFYIGAVLGVHDKGSTRPCGPLKPSAIQNLEAFLWAVSTFKTRYNKLQNEEIGAIVFDSCKQSSRAIQQVMNLESGEVSFGAPAIKPSRVLAWVGADSDDEAVQLEPVLKSFGKTLVSHAASGPQLSQGFSNLLRTVPSQTHQVHAIAELLRVTEWRYVQLVYTDDLVGTQSQKLLMSLLKGKNSSHACISHLIKLPKMNSDQDAMTAVEKLMTHVKTRVVVILANSDTTRKILTAANDLEVRGSFTWIGTTSWGKDEGVSDGLEAFAEGAVTLDHEEGSQFLEMFKLYWSTRKPSNQDPNPWFQEYWENHFSCSGVNCNYNSQSLAKVPLDKYVPYIIKAVDAVLHGIANASKVQCASDQSLCDDFMSYANKWDIIRSNILDVNIPGVRFDSNTGDTKMGNYSLYNYRASDYNCQNHCYKKIGFYDSNRSKDKLVLTQPIKSYDSSGGVMSNITTMCSESPCFACGELATTLMTTEAFEIYEVINDDVIPPQKSIRDSAWIYALIVLASIGLIFVVGLEIFLLLKVCDQRYGRNLRSMWLGQVLLFGVFLAYLTLFAFIPEPSKATCGIIRFGVGVSYAICFSVLLVKLMVILSSQDDGRLQNIFQVLMLFFAVFLQIVIDIEWLILRHPQAIYDTEYGWMCLATYESHVKSLVYVMFLIFITTIISISTHGIVTNHREGMFIGLVAGFSIPVWVAWILVGMLNENKAFEDPSIAYGLFITTTLVLSLMFIPKVRQINGMSNKGLYVEDEIVEYAPALVTKSPMPTGPGSVVMSPVGAGSIAGDTLVYANPPIVKEGSVVLLNGDYHGGFANGGFANSMVNGGLGSLGGGVAYAEPMQAKPLHLHYDADPNALYLRHPGPPQNFLGPPQNYRGPSAPGSVSSAPVGANSVRKKNARLLRITRDLTGSTYNAPVSTVDGHDGEPHYATSTRSVTSTKSGSVKGERSIQDLGYL